MAARPRPRRRHPLALPLALATALAAGSARAADGSTAVAPMRVRASTRVALPCSLPRDLAPLWQRLRVELAAEGVAWVDDSAEAPVVISLALAACGARPLDMTVSASRPGTGRRSRVVSLRNALSPDGARTVALIVAEFVRSALQELADDAPTDPALADARPLVEPAIVNAPPVGGAAPPPALPKPAAPANDGDDPPSAPDVDTPRDRSVAAPTLARSGLAAELVVRGYPAESTVLLGPRLSASYPLSGRWALRVGAMSAWGGHDAAIGSAAIWCATAALGAALTLPAGPLRLEIGPELEVGYARARGRAERADVVAESGDGAVLVTVVHARVVGRLVPSWRWFLAAEVGQTLLGIAWKADERTVGGLNGLQLGGGVGAMLVF